MRAGRRFWKWLRHAMGTLKYDPMGISSGQELPYRIQQSGVGGRSDSMTVLNGKLSVVIERMGAKLKIENG